MAGANQILKAGQVLFKAGDPSEGMYLIRKGELCVFLEKDGKEVVLANVGDGGMIGEMALFDRQPRSASVKAVSDTEVTLISNDDFSKLMKQIPKWFVGLMAALSGRLRSTNERLQKVESSTSGKGPPFQTVVRILNVFNLLWHKDGTREGKVWCMEKQNVMKILQETFGEEPARLNALFEILVHNQLLTTKQDNYKNVIFTMVNKAVLERLILFLNTYLKDNKGKAEPLSPEAIDILKALNRLAEKSAYDTVNVSLTDLEIEGKRAQCKTENWKAILPSLKHVGEGVSLIKMSDGSLGFRVASKDIEALIQYHAVLSQLHRQNLA